MEVRLLPVNAILGLLTRDDINPAALADAGFRLAGLEVPIVGPNGRVVADLVLFHAQRAHLVLVEAKSGANVEISQAARYTTLDPIAVVQATGVSVPRRGPVSAEVAYACLDEHAQRIRQGLDQAGLPCAMIRLAEHSISLERPTPTITPLDTAWAAGPIALRGPVVRLLPFDHESDAASFEPAVRAQLIGELAHRRTEVTIRLLTEQVTPYFAIFAVGAQERLVSKVRQVVRGIIEEDPRTYGYLPRTSTRRDDAVEFRGTPEDRDPRGRTQAYQAMHVRRGQPLIQDDHRQLDLLDLLAETTPNDTVVDAEDTEGEEV